MKRFPRSFIFGFVAPAVAVALGGTALPPGLQPCRQAPPASRREPSVRDSVLYESDVPYGAACGDVKELEGSNGSPGQSSQVACVVDFCGPSDLPNFFKSRAVGSQGALASLLGGTVEEKKAEAIAASPITHVTRNASPFLIM